MKKSIGTAWLVLMIALLAGCAATPTVREEGRTSDLSRFSTVQVIVDAPASVKSVEGYEDAAAELTKAFTEAVRATGKFPAVGPNAAGSAVLEARLSIDELNYVHGAGRAIAGILAGRAILKVTMTLRDKANGAALGSVTADHQSSHLQGVFSPTTSRQIDAVAKELASKL